MENGLERRNVDAGGQLEPFAIVQGKDDGSGVVAVKMRGYQLDLQEFEESFLMVKYERAGAVKRKQSSSLAPWHRVAGGILVPRGAQGSKLCPPRWKLGILTTGPPGKSHDSPVLELSL